MTYQLLTEKQLQPPGVGSKVESYTVVAKELYGSWLKLKLGAALMIVRLEADEGHAKVTVKVVMVLIDDQFFKLAVISTVNV